MYTISSTALVIVGAVMGEVRAFSAHLIAGDQRLKVQFSEPLAK